MFTKTVLVLAVIVTTASGALAQTHRNPANDVFSNGKYLGSDPSPTVRFMLQHDQGAE